MPDPKPSRRSLLSAHSATDSIADVPAAALAHNDPDSSADGATDFGTHGAAGAESDILADGDADNRTADHGRTDERADGRADFLSNAGAVCASVRAPNARTVVSADAATDPRPHARADARAYSRSHDLVHADDDDAVPDAVADAGSDAVAHADAAARPRGRASGDRVRGLRQQRLQLRARRHAPGRVVRRARLRERRLGRRDAARLDFDRADGAAIRAE